MKKRILFIGAFVWQMAAFAQAPQKLSYQSVVRNSTNNLVTNAAVGVRMSILQGSASGTPVYVETHTTNTNTNGLATLSIGSGTVVSGSMASIVWSAGPYFVKTETDPTGGTNYTVTGTSELMSVPYALYAENAGTSGPAGPVGPQGPIGLTGPAGATGSQGPIGLTGPAGATGAQGPIGNDGPIGLTGPAGTTGTQGPIGLTGAAGAQGPIGLTGATGVQGPIGLTGPAGAIGATGVQGPAGPIAGSNQQIIFNNSGSPDGSANLLWNNATSVLSTSNLAATNGAITGLGGFGTRNVQVDNLGNLTAANPSTGTENYYPKWTGTSPTSTLGNSIMRENATGNVSINITPSNIYRLITYQQQLTANGDGQHSLFGYRTRDSQNDGTGYSQIAANSATAGFNFWGDVYTFGVAGWNYNDYSRCGGTFGADVNGLQWGSLGYRSSGLLNYGVYGNAAYATGGGFLGSAEKTCIGGGFHGDMAGSWSKGSVMGHISSGELFASYNSGDVYTSGQQIALINTGGENKTAAYTMTSTEAVVYKKGTITLNNGTARVNFDNAYASLLGEAPVVTTSAMGECNGVYIVSVDKTGFTVKEIGQGTSNVNVAWIAVGDRIDAKEHAVPTSVLDKNFDKNINDVMFDEGDKEHKGKGMWWDGTKLNFGEIPAHLIPKHTNKKELGQR